MTDMNPAQKLLRDGPVVVNIGLKLFAENLGKADVPVQHVRWRPPLEVKPEVRDALRKLSGSSSSEGE